MWYAIGIPVGLLLLLAVLVATRPADFRIVRSARIAAPPATVFAQVNDFHNWKAWSPWAKIDPAMKETYDGPSSGVGAKYAWLGNKQVGEGRMTIAESRPSEFLRINLEFIKPFQANHTAEFRFTPDGNQTAVEWSMNGHNGFVSKAFFMFVNMDKLIGRDFEKGLKQLKEVAERPA